MRDDSRIPRATTSASISNIASRLAAAFRKQLIGVKRRLGSNDLRWYPYDTLQVFSVLERMLSGEHRYLVELAGGRPVLDIGCGDGDMSFFLESLGCQVHALDLPATNFNQMRGVAALKQALNSPLQIFQMDLDELAALPHNGYGLTICLGLLYHLKNPYSLLERLARITHYCLLSTRVARYTPDHQTDLRELPVAYLLDECEANDDPTNFWVFSETGLKRILKRTGWQICGWTSNGCSDDSDPASTDRDQRVFCLLKSPVFERSWEVALLDGWHAMEAGHFRWTGRQFGVRLKSRQAGACRALSFDFYLPEAHLERLGPLTLRAALNGCELPAQTFRQAGRIVTASACRKAQWPAASRKFNSAWTKPRPPRRKIAVNWGWWSPSRVPAARWRTSTCRSSWSRRPPPGPLWQNSLHVTAHSHSRKRRSASVGQPGMLGRSAARRGGRHGRHAARGPGNPARPSLQTRKRTRLHR